jgi:hypothetical protein
MVKNPKAKGQRIEREAEEWLQDRGFLTARQNNTRFGNNDYFNKFDILALPTTSATLRDLVDSEEENVSDINASESPSVVSPLLVQVKANTAAGVTETAEWIDKHFCKDAPIDNRRMRDTMTRFFYMVKHDYEGWRILEFDADERGFIKRYDDR